MWGSLILIGGVLVYLLDKKESFVTVYEGTESSLKEAIDYYWILKSYKFKQIKYEIPYNFENFFHFGYHECVVRIKVKREDVNKVKEVLRNYRAEQRKIERNILNSKRFE